MHEVFIMPSRGVEIFSHPILFYILCSVRSWHKQWRSEGPAGPATAGARGAEGVCQEEVVAVTPWPGAQTSCSRGGGRKSSLRYWA